MEKHKQCLDEFIVRFLNCIDLYYHPHSSLPCYIPRNAKIKSWPPEENTVRKWLSKEPLVSIEIRGPIAGPQEVNSEINYRKAEDITPEMVHGIIQDFKAMENPQKALQEARQYEAMHDKLETQLRNIRTKLKVIIEKNNLPEPFTYAVHPEKSAPCYAVDSLDNALRYIMITEKEYKQDRKGCASLKDYLAEKLRKQKDECLGKWSKEINSLPSGERRRNDIITVNIRDKDIDLTEKEALCLLAFKEAAVKDKRINITPDIIACRVWTDATLETRTKRLKPHWNSLKKKLGKDFSLSDFRMKDLNGVKDYQLSKPPTWLKDVVFPKSFSLPFKPRRG